eukprot:3420899-Rhodomonas_salina.1
MKAPCLKRKNALLGRKVVPAIHTAPLPCELIPGRSSMPAPGSVRRHCTGWKQGCRVGCYTGYRTRTAHYSMARRYSGPNAP